VERAVRRVEQVVDGTPPGPARDALEQFLPRVDLVARAARARCLQAQLDSPSSQLLVPGGAAGEVHRSVTRTATACAQVAEAAAMVRVAETFDPASIASVERAVVKAETLAGLR
jgi:hypothetical protein